MSGWEAMPTLLEPLDAEHASGNAATVRRSGIRRLFFFINAFIVPMGISVVAVVAVAKAVHRAERHRALCGAFLKSETSIACRR